MSNPSEVVGFIGLGNLGTPIAQRIAAAGFRMVVWNRTATRMELFRAQGGDLAQSAFEVAQRADIIFTCVDSTAALGDILFGQQGISRDKPRASLVVDHSTLSPLSEQEFGRRLLEEVGMGLIDVPLSGGAVGARMGTLAAMAGGEARWIERARPIMAHYTGRIVHMGPLGAGQATKACNQIINCLAIAAVAEAMTLGKRCGIDTRKLPEALLGGFGDSKVLREYDRSVSEGDASPIRSMIDALAQYNGGVESFERLKAIELALKDLSIAMEMGRACGGQIPLTTHLSTIFRAMHDRQICAPR